MCKNKLKWSFIHCTQVLKTECAMECPPFKENLIHTSIQRESKQLLPAKKSKRGCTFLVSCLSIHKRNDNVVLDLMLFKTNCLDIINEYFWNSPSKQINLFDYLSHIFLWRINNR